MHALRELRQRQDDAALLMNVVCLVSKDVHGGPMHLACTSSSMELVMRAGPTQGICAWGLVHARGGPPHLHKNPLQAPPTLNPNFKPMHTHHRSRADATHANAKPLQSKQAVRLHDMVHRHQSWELCMHPLHDAERLPITMHWKS